ncbi:MAG TPA: diacylglycerol kinase family protein [Pyrinomonadaceae bacterium]|jgi:diacylglycerol kinase family enzyme|nr:diacylglycerol kinase family protein [Pyrinomonadaceae bacterium]
MSSHPAVIINATSGANAKESERDRLADIFAARGLRASITLAQSGADIVELARRAVREDCNPIVAGGGDGTINAVASALVGTRKLLGVLPLGTLNHFAKDLKIPLDLEGAATNILEGHAARVDVGEVNGRIFLNNSSLGLYPTIVRHREKQQERLGRGKWPAFFWAAITVLRRYPFLTVRLSTDKEEMVRRTPFIFVGNNEYEMESFNVGARSCLDAGQLSLYTAHRTGRLGLLRFAVRALFGGLRDEKDFDALCTSEVWIETRRRRLRVATDGEVTIMTTPLHYRVLPGALSVLVPRPLAEDGKGKE